MIPKIYFGIGLGAETWFKMMGYDPNSTLKKHYRTVNKHYHQLRLRPGVDGITNLEQK